MFRRHKGHKSRPGGSNSHWGGEYWGRRPGGREPGRFTKTHTHRLERRHYLIEIIDIDIDHDVYPVGCSYDK